MSDPRQTDARVARTMRGLAGLVVGVLIVVLAGLGVLVWIDANQTAQLHHQSVENHKIAVANGRQLTEVDSILRILQDATIPGGKLCEQGQQATANAIRQLEQFIAARGGG